MWKSAVVLLAMVGLCAVSATQKLKERYNWKQMDFVFPNQRLKQQALASGDYVPTNGLPVGIERWENKLFVSVPRWKDGIPSTLNYIDMNKTPSGSPPLIPYPDWSSNVAGDCQNGLSTVYRIKADKCGRLWLLDTGTVGIGNTTQQLCPYALNIFDLKTNRRIRRYELRPEDTNPNTFIANIAIDMGRSCDDTFAYMSDELGYGLIVYSFEKNKSWRFAHSFFFPDPLRGDFNIAGLNFQWGEEGIFGMSLTPLQADGYRTLYFSPLASHREFMVSTKILRNEDGVEESFHDFQYLKERGPNSHTTSRVMSETGLQLFNLIDQNAVGCWHSSLPYSPEYHGLVDQDDVELVFPADVKIDEEENVWVISDRMPVFLIAELDYSDINFRIFSAPLSTLVAGTVCDTQTPYATAIQSKFGAPELTTYPGTTLVPTTFAQPISYTPSSYAPTIAPITAAKYTSNHFEAPASPLYTTQRYPTTATAYHYNKYHGIEYQTHGDGHGAHYHHHHEDPHDHHHGPYHGPDHDHDHDHSGHFGHRYWPGSEKKQDSWKQHYY
ncbi:protein yellow [Toxorhynchites rutilus septentrionalis]|uniref:protein yellow n=1 Tax=Toxorhynchites rutilus septentrionalis TaxID=329112 RepID=UPI002479456F|nr:protein yellow [Toxorhynchites rutilus septentrionalis]